MQAKGILSFGNILLYGQEGNKTPARLPDDGLKKIHGVVVRAFSVFDLKAYARAGMLLPTGNWISADREPQSSPGITPSTVLFCRVALQGLRGLNSSA